ncbi:hypothetical protein U9M48_043782 [Paspalum notatum var. saurae]|uniref:Dehydrin n=1 Tax=Paspalum notatum var. saurae TaxID=547442 RepID=A0AAQ3XGT8_PASNO
MEHQRQHGHDTTGAEGYDNPVAAHHQHGGDTTGMPGHGEAGAGGQFQPVAGEEHRSRGILHRSGSSSSSSSSEDDGMGGRRKKGLKEKIKEKLPAATRTTSRTRRQGPVPTASRGTRASAAAQQGLMEPMAPAMVIRRVSWTRSRRSSQAITELLPDML